MQHNHQTPNYWSDALTYLSDSDPVMATIIARYSGESLRCRGDAFYTLCRSIVGQQISVKAADSVWGKLETLTQPLAPATIVLLSEEQLRSCGLSRQKITYLRNIALHFQQQHIDGNYFDAMSDAEVIEELTHIKGVGKWTAEMFLIFHLMRPDIFPLDDIGVQKAIERAFNKQWSEKDSKNKKKKYAYYQKIAETWRPYRTVATWYLWRSLDPVPVAY